MVVKVTKWLFLLFLEVLFLVNIAAANDTVKPFAFLKIEGPIFLDGVSGIRKAPFSMEEIVQASPNAHAVSDGDWTSGSISFWVKPEGYPQEGNVWDILRLNWYAPSRPSMGHVCSLSLTSEGKILVHDIWSWERSYVGEKEPELESIKTLPLGMWSQVVLQWDKAIGKTSLFINWDWDMDINNFIAIAVHSPTGEVYPWIGGYGGFKGFIRDLRLWGMPSAMINLYMEDIRDQGVQDFEDVIAKDLSFSCSMPTRGWAREKRVSSLNSKGIYDLILRNDSDGSLLRIQYFGPESGQGFDDFIRSNATSAWINPIVVNDIAGKVLDIEEKSHKERIYAIPSRRGFFAITYSVTRENFYAHLNLVKLIVNTIGIN